MQRSAILRHRKLDAVAAVLLDGLSYRRAGHRVGISKTEVGDGLDLLLGELAALGCCQPDGTFITALGDLRERLVEMAEVGKAVCVDGLAAKLCWKAPIARRSRSTGGCGPISATPTPIQIHASLATLTSGPLTRPR